MRKRPAGDRGHGQHGWLDTRHSFSFGEYFDPGHSGFRALRVLNEDRVAPGAGFGTHAHRDMEIVTYVLSGALEHRDSTGVGSVLRPGQVQRMTAGSGIAHSEMNHSKSEPVHFLQVWILPEVTGLKPDYEERLFTRDQLHDRLHLIASRQGLDGSLTIHRDVRIYAAVLSPGRRVTLELEPGRHGWVQLAGGRVVAEADDRVQLSAGDGLAISDVTRVVLAADDESEMLVFDLD